MTQTNGELLRTLDRLPAEIRSLTLAVASEANVDLAMALITLLSGMGAAVHGIRAVARPDRNVESLGLFHILLAGTTSGKTRVHRVVHAAHVAHDMRRIQEYAAKRNRGERREQLREVIHALSTKRALLGALEGIGHSTAISEREGNRVLQTPFFRRELDVANVLWDGDDRCAFVRPNGDRLVAMNAGLNMLVMVQREMFASYLSVYGASARSIGFLPRCLIATAQQHLKALPSSGDPDVLVAYYARVQQYLEIHKARVEQGLLEPDVMDFSPLAVIRFEQMQQELAQGSVFRYFGIQDAVNRAMQQVVRLSGIIHSFIPRFDHLEEAPLGEISVEVLEAAWEIVQWHLDQFRLVVTPVPDFSPKPLKLTTQERRLKQILEDAETIIQHFNIHRARTNNSEVPKKVLTMRSGLYAQRFNAALFYLTDEGLLTTEGEGRRTRLSAGPRLLSPVVMPAGGNPFSRFV